MSPSSLNCVNCTATLLADSGVSLAVTYAVQGRACRNMPLRWANQAHTGCYPREAPMPLGDLARAHQRGCGICEHRRSRQALHASQPRVQRTASTATQPALGATPLVKPLKPYATARKWNAKGHVSKDTWLKKGAVSLLRA